MLIRALDPIVDLDRVATFYAQAPDYWILADGKPPGPEKAAAFFTERPPGSDLETWQRLGLFVEGRLSGVAELSFGFPAPGDAYLGLMILGPWAQGAGLGAAFLAHVEGLARSAQAPILYLGVLEANPRGRAFWEREGFSATGVTRVETEGLRHVIHRLGKRL